MQFGSWDTVFNLLVLIVWFRIWTDNDRDIFFNPYLAPLERAVDPVLHFLRSALPIPPRLLAALLVPVLLMLRGLAVPAAADWRLFLGFERGAIMQGTLPAVLFSFLSFAVFLFKVWGISLIYVRGQAPPSQRAPSALYYFSRPFTDLKHEIRPFVLLAIGVVLVALVDGIGRIPETTSKHADLLVMTIDKTGSSPFLLGTQYVILALAGWVQLLLVLQGAMILLIICSWAAMFMGAPGLHAFCKDWMDLLLGPLRRYPMRLGMFDLSPIVFFIGLQMLFGILMSILAASYGILT